MPLPEFKGKGLFVFSDPGGARNVLALCKQLHATLDDMRIVSDRAYSFYADFGLEVESYHGIARDYFSDFKPDFLLCGTSYTSGIALEFITEAKQPGIPSYAYIDHWTSLRKRFTWKDNPEVLPSGIMVIDEKAKEIALQEGFSNNQIIIAGQPYLSYLQTWQPKLTREAFMSSIGAEPGNKKIAIYAPDPLSNVDGLATYGFDEVSATGELSKHFGRHTNLLVLLKPHPNQSLEKLQPFSNTQLMILDKHTDSNHLIYYSDVVIGFFSNFLLEANAMKKPVVRYHPLATENDPLAHLNVGSIASKENINDILNTVLW
jgi:hypothetical protein